MKIVRVGERRRLPLLARDRQRAVAAANLAAAFVTLSRDLPSKSACRLAPVPLPPEVPCPLSDCVGLAQALHLQVTCASGLPLRISKLAFHATHR